MFCYGSVRLNLQRCKRLNAESLVKLACDSDLMRQLGSASSCLVVGLLALFFSFKLLNSVAELTASLSREHQMLLFNCLARNNRV